MNDKIRELLKESGFCFWADEPWGPGAGKIDWNCDYEKEFDRFVELLVTECAITAANAEGICGVTAEAIKTHFGIESKAEEVDQAFENWLRYRQQITNGGELSDEEFENWCRESDDGSAADYVDCKTHPDAPHGFSRNASHNADRYVCECEHWEEPK